MMDKKLIQKIMEIRRASNSSCEEAAEKIIAAVRAHDDVPDESATPLSRQVLVLQEKLQDAEAQVDMLKTQGKASEKELAEAHQQIQYFVEQRKQALNPDIVGTLGYWVKEAEAFEKERDAALIELAQARLAVEKPGENKTESDYANLVARMQADLEERFGVVKSTAYAVARMYAEWAGKAEPEGEKLWIGLLVDCGKFVGTTNAYRDKSQVENEIACSSRFIGLAPVYLPKAKTGKESLIAEAEEILTDNWPVGKARDVIKRLLAEVKGVKS
jgi:hypothetical protein